MKQTEIMTPQHPEWEKFCFDLEHCVVDCNSVDTHLAQLILKKKHPKVNISQSVKWWQEHGGYCDCEIMLNIKYKGKK